MNIKDLTSGMKRVNVKGVISDKEEPRQVQSRYKDETYVVANATLSDATGAIALTLWDTQINQVEIGDQVSVENGYVTEFKGALQLNVGKFGKLTVIP
jgi:ssDNA-binding replication factor A large subunit